MNKIYIFLIALLNSSYLFGQTGFASSPINWQLPSGGKVSSSHNYGFNESFYDANNTIGNQSWVCMDINGDLKQDLIIMAESNGSYVDCYGAGGSQYWKVYLNNGNSFATSSVNWSLPSGGKVISGHTYGFNQISYVATSHLNNQSWAVFDINGDNKPDLVVTSQSNGTYTDCFGVGSNPYWKVYLNNGSGFSSTSINWTLPAGGKILSGHAYGYNEISYAASSFNGNQTWYTSDINGDSKPDLIICAQSDGVYLDCFGVGSSPYWKVYLNNGSGFSSTSVNWSLPSGGKILSGHTNGFNDLFYNTSSSAGSQSWSTIDMNGDGKPELVVIAQSNGTYTDCFGVGSNPYWKVYWNNGSGFSSTSMNWPLPNGGKIITGHSYGFNELFYDASSTNGNQSWSTTDINGDLRPDLIVHAQSNGTYTDCFGIGSNPYWKVYLNSGSGFSGAILNFTVPSGGRVSSSHDYGFVQLNSTAGGSTLGNQYWSTFDINGDKKLDLLVHSEGDGIYVDCYGVGSNPYWKVYLNNASVNNLDEHQQLANEAVLYPNPFMNDLSVKLAGAENLPYQLLVYNVQGQLVQQNAIISSSQNVIFDIPSGIYLYQIKDSNLQSLSTGKLIKQ